MVIAQALQAKNMIKKGVTVLVIIAILGVLLGLSRQINESLGARGRLDRAEADVLRLEEENLALQERLKSAKSVSFIERSARNNLNLAKSNETIFIISDKAIAKALEQKREEEIKSSNWQGWLKLFL
jgi:cell division protein FtsB